VPTLHRLAWADGTRESYALLHGGRPFKPPAHILECLEGYGCLWTADVAAQRWIAGARTKARKEEYTGERHGLQG
jgi:hypothetical protein